MLYIALSFLGGILLVQQWQVLPDTLVLLQLAAGLACIYVISGFSGFPRQFSAFFRYLMMFFLGISWAVITANTSLQHRLPEYLAGQTVLVQGRVTGIPQNTPQIKRFYLRVEKFISETAQEKPPRLLRLSWYSTKKFKVNDVHAGEVWQLKLRLKPPHGFFNPGGFDYEGWLFQQGVDATGYVYQNASSLSENIKLSAATASGWVDSLRQEVSQSIHHWLSDDDQLSAMAGLLTALAVGDRAGVQADQWQDLLHTGTNHMMAISGLHIGLAYLFGYLLGRWLTPVSLMKRYPAQQVGVLTGMLMATAYALLAGFSIPSQRAFLMMLSFACAALLRRNFSALDALGLALLLVLVWDPLSVLSPGFWFSFIAVAVIFYSLSENGLLRPLRDNSQIAVNPDTGADITNNRVQTVRQQMRAFGHKVLFWTGLQVTLTLALFPLSLYLFQQSSLVAPLANLILVPYVSFLVVPFVLFALLCYPFSLLLSEWCFSVAASLLQWIWPFLHFLADLPFAYYVEGMFSSWHLILAAVALSLLLIPLKLLVKVFERLGYFPAAAVVNGFRFAPVVLLFAPLLFHHRSEVDLKHGEFTVTILDVGQGLANVVQTANHTLVFDTGARFSDKLDAGTSVVLPFLRSRGVRDLDILMISHGDADHIGGAASVLNEYPETRLIGQDLAKLVAANTSACERDMHWQWEGVDFMVLHPSEPEQPVNTSALSKRTRRGERNNHSCVLRISSVYGSALLTGDIEKPAEKQLMQTSLPDLASTLLVAPHHGSKTSSSSAFIQAVRPELVVFSAGYRNRYHLPATDIEQRYQRQQIKALQTGLVGAVQVVFRQGVTPEKGTDSRIASEKAQSETGSQRTVLVDAWRLSHHHYWNHRSDAMFPDTAPTGSIEITKNRQIQ